MSERVLDMRAGGFPERTYVGKDTTVADLAARVSELEAENARLRKSSDLAAALADEFEKAVASRDPVRGMQVPPSSDFLACAQLPSAVKRMAWWAREIRAARAEVDKP